MKNIIRIAIMTFGLLFDMLAVNACINYLFNRFFDVMFLFSPLLIVVTYIKPLLILFGCNKLFKTDSNYKNKFVNIWISFVVFYLFCIIISQKTILEGDFLFFDINIYAFVSFVFTAVLSVYYWKSRGDSDS